MLKNNKKHLISNLLTKDILEDLDKAPKKNIDDDTWEKLNNSVLFKSFNNYKSGSKLLSFDLDDTLIFPKGKKKFGSESNDYIFFTNKDEMLNKINKYISNGYVLAIFSNQHGIEKGYITEEKFKKKINNIMNDLKLPLLFFSAISKDYYRKPLIGMMDLFIEKNKAQIDKTNSIYIGDAAGRKKNNNYKKNDHSDSDYKFALNCEIKFMTPEEFFLNSKQEIPKIDFDLHKYDNLNNDHIKFDNNQEMIIMVGSPGSGKSTYSENYLVNKGYIRINQDILKNQKNCMKKAENEIKNKKSVVIDNTNPTINVRKNYINLAKNYKLKVRCFYIDIPKQLAFHLNNLRNVNNERKHFSESVNQIPIHTFYKHLEIPTLEEGFDEIVNLNFVPGPFVNDKDKKLFYLYN